MSNFSRARKTDDKGEVMRDNHMMTGESYRRKRNGEFERLWVLGRIGIIDD